MGCQCTKNNSNDKGEIQKNLLNDLENVEGNNLEVVGDRGAKLGGALDYNQNKGNVVIEANHENLEKMKEERLKGISEQQMKYADYPEKVIELLNRIRQDPVKYADVIEESIRNIIVDNNKDDPTKAKIIYKRKVKVALNRGEEAFKEAAEELRKMEPLEPLVYKPELCLGLPENEDEMKDSTFLRHQARLVKQNTQIDVFFKDLIKVPEVSVLLMTVDDNGKNDGKKRQAVLSKEFKYIGVSSKFIGKNFIAYFSFSK